MSPLVTGTESCAMSTVPDVLDKCHPTFIFAFGASVIVIDSRVPVPPDADLHFPSLHAAVDVNSITVFVPLSICVPPISISVTSYSFNTVMIS